MITFDEAANLRNSATKYLNTQNRFPNAPAAQQAKLLCNHVIQTFTSKAMKGKR